MSTPPPANDHRSVIMETSVVPGLVPGTWIVESIDNADDGAVYSTVFFGPLAEKRARAYAAIADHHIRTAERNS